MKLIELIVCIDNTLKRIEKMRDAIDTDYYLVNDYVTVNGLNMVLDMTCNTYKRLIEEENISEIFSKYNNDRIIYEFKLYYHYLKEMEKFLITILHRQKTGVKIPLITSNIE